MNESPPHNNRAWKTLRESDFVEASPCFDPHGGEVGQTACQTDHVTTLRSQDARIILESQNTSMHARTPILQARVQFCRQTTEDTNDVHAD